VEDCTLEFDATIDEKDNIYLIYQKKDGKIALILLSRPSNLWETTILQELDSLPIINLNLILYKETIHVIYCIPSIESNRLYSIYHYFYNALEWKKLQLGEICIKKLLNPFQIIKQEDKLVMGFYNLINNEEQIFIKEFDIKKEEWENTVQLTYSFNDKLYLDLMMIEDEVLHLTYSQYHQGNLVIKYEKYKIMENKSSKLMESVLSNDANCSHPTFVKYGDKLWTIWTEYDQVVSSFTSDSGLTWSPIYLWKESKEKNFFRYKFGTNNPKLKDYCKLNYTFGKDYPEFSFMGFGPLQEVVEVPRLFKKNDSHDSITKLQETIEQLENRIEDIEEYINRRRRNPFFPRR
jgi:hypothetical protein